MYLIAAGRHIEPNASRHFGKDGTISFPGKHYNIEDITAYPRPVQRPMPIMMGARGNRMLRLATREAKIIGIMEGGEAEASLPEKMAVIREAAGERFGELEFTKLFFNVQVRASQSSTRCPVIVSRD